MRSLLRQGFEYFLNMIFFPPNIPRITDSQILCLEIYFMETMVVAQTSIRTGIAVVKKIKLLITLKKNPIFVRFVMLKSVLLFSCDCIPFPFVTISTSTSFYCTSLISVDYVFFYKIHTAFAQVSKKVSTYI